MTNARVNGFASCSQQDRASSAVFNHLFALLMDVIVNLLMSAAA